MTDSFLGWWKGKAAFWASRSSQTKEVKQCFEDLAIPHHISGAVCFVLKAHAAFHGLADAIIALQRSRHGSDLQVCCEIQAASPGGVHRIVRDVPLTAQRVTVASVKEASQQQEPIQLTEWDEWLFTYMGKKSPVVPVRPFSA